jgi:hypothetical protein
MSRKTSVKDRLIREYKLVAAKALREPRTNKEMLSRIKWERLKKILGRRYDIIDMSQL